LGFIGHEAYLLLDVDAAVAADVAKRRASLGQDLADEQAAMTITGILLAAHHGRAAALRLADKSLEAKAESVRRRDHVVSHVTVVVVGVAFGRASSEFIAQKHVVDPALPQTSLEWRSVEVR
jgi:hypothetical protein